MLAIWCLRPGVRILHSAEEDNLSPFDSKIACLCQSIEINNNKHIYKMQVISILNCNYFLASFQGIKFCFDSKALIGREMNIMSKLINLNVLCNLLWGMQ